MEGSPLDYMLVPDMYMIAIGSRKREFLLISILFFFKCCLLLRFNPYGLRTILYFKTDLKFLNCTNKNEKKTQQLCFHVLFYILYVTRHLALTIAVNAKNSNNVFSIRKNYNVCKFKKSIPYDLQINTYLTYFH